ncbi:hypothetical protein QBC39DRAFT_342660 [Podospora conica]|nr:hypothetical protein QBC39DRAFT_342660 [Schizothecium conicum]
MAGLRAEHIPETSSESSTILATLGFLAEAPIYRTEKPFAIVGLPEGEVPDDQKTNLIYEFKPSVPVTDARSLAPPEPLSLDANGFTWIRHRSSHLVDTRPFTSVSDDRGTVDAFLQETINMTKEAADASVAYVYDWRYRKSESTYNNRDFGEGVKNTRYVTLAPIGHVHVDFSYQGGLDCVYHHLTGSELEGYLAQKRRIRLINAWRPLRRVQRDALGVCDRRSVRPEDVLEVDKVLPNNVELETYIYHRPHHKWYYMSEQTPEDVLLFVQWEEHQPSKEIAGVPHATLRGPQATFGEEARESLEVRMIVIS